MTYICKDRGSDKCPCILMESGQCYTCGMSAGGKCDCLPGWQGVCPLNEYMQGSIVKREKTEIFEIEESTFYSKDFLVIVLLTSAGFALRCKEMGAFLMIESEGFKFPISVMKSDINEGKGHIHLAIYMAGPKTLNLAKCCEKGQYIRAAGPFTSGLMNSEAFQYGRPSVILAKGMALMPLINQKERICSNMISMYLDTDKLPDGFIQNYFDDVEYKEVDFANDMEKVAGEFGEICDECWYANVLLLLSPYYVNQFLKMEIFTHRTPIYPNHSNMCCGEGICGACSFTDASGITVRKCKCNESIQKEV